jgi:hypothetical protein
MEFPIQFDHTDAQQLRARVSRPRWVRIGSYSCGAVVVLGLGILGSLGLIDWVRMSRRKECSQHLKKFGKAFIDYHETHGKLPAPAIASAKGEPLLSWRVEVLPYLGYQSLFDRFHRNEPWNSGHNRALLAEMPREFACPAGPRRESGRTGFQIIVGPESDETSVNTAFERTRGYDLRSFTDGTSNTIVALETRAMVPWTKPDDLAWSPSGAVPAINSHHKGGAHALLGDGTVRFFTRKIDMRTLISLLTINGGETLGG